jgi:hypothetical protein
MWRAQLLNDLSDVHESLNFGQGFMDLQTEFMNPQPDSASCTLITAPCELLLIFKLTKIPGAYLFFITAEGGA